MKICFVIHTNGLYYKKKKCVAYPIVNFVGTFLLNNQNFNNKIRFLYRNLKQIKVLCHQIYHYKFILKNMKNQKTQRYRMETHRAT
jgi:hypothetical protein